MLACVLLILLTEGPHGAHIHADQRPCFLPWCSDSISLQGSWGLHPCSYVMKLTPGCYASVNAVQCMGWQGSNPGLSWVGSMQGKTSYLCAITLAYALCPLFIPASSYTTHCTLRQCKQVIPEQQREQHHPQGFLKSSATNKSSHKNVSCALKINSSKVTHTSFILLG